MKDTTRLPSGVSIRLGSFFSSRHVLSCNWLGFGNRVQVRKGKFVTCIHAKSEEG